MVAGNSMPVAVRWWTWLGSGQVRVVNLGVSTDHRPPAPCYLPLQPVLALTPPTHKGHSLVIPSPPESRFGDVCGIVGKNGTNSWVHQGRFSPQTGFRESNEDTRFLFLVAYVSDPRGRVTWLAMLALDLVFRTYLG